jgi:phosphopantothenoylcysteine synthetase/decarboxylase
MGDMNVLVTAGNTRTMIDRVRCITNIFSGRTGAAIAREAFSRGHHVMLLTSHPETVAGGEGESDRFRCVAYNSFGDLHQLMQSQLRRGGFDVVIHAAAVNDYDASGVYAPSQGTSFDAAHASWRPSDGEAVRLEDRSAGKVKSDEPELWLRLTRLPKLIDMVREPWGFRGTLVKFKLEVGVSDEQLLDLAERSRRQSDADWMVANTLEGTRDWAYLGSAAGYERIERAQLADRLISVVEGSARG